MTRSPLFYPLNRGMDAEAGGAADLQTDVMRFMAILSLCLVAIFALTPLAAYYWIMFLAVPLRGGKAAALALLVLAAAWFNWRRALAGHRKRPLVGPPRIRCTMMRSSKRWRSADEEPYRLEAQLAQRLS